MSGPGGPATRGAIEGQVLLTYFPAIFLGPRPAGGALDLFGPQGWSNADDSRILRTPTTLYPWRTITQSSFSATDTESRCTMTLIGPRHLITAAHCLVDFGTTNWKARQLVPARDGVSVMPYGSTQMTPNPPPGEEAWYIVPDPWLDPGTPSGGTEEYQWDIGAVLMLDRLGDQTGWMGYNAYPASDLNTRNQLNRGYPRCNAQEAPDGCQPHRLYGDTQYCEVGYYHHPGSNNWNREFAFSCDISRGHSGSPLYHYRYVPSWGAQGPYVAAVVSWHECLDDAPGQCTTADDYPNHARRITPWVRGWISWLKEQFP
jgi:V8-like Glu-specific endopeptidase